MQSDDRGAICHWQVFPIGGDQPRPILAHCMLQAGTELGDKSHRNRWVWMWKGNLTMCFQVTQESFIEPQLWLIGM